MSIEIKDLFKSFDGTPVLRGVSLTVEPGELRFVVGPSGTGKSVLMRHVNGLLRPDEGEVWVDNLRVDTLSERALLEVRRTCGFVFQHPTLLGHLSLEENVALPLTKALGMPWGEAHDRARAWLERVGLGPLASAHPAQISAGQQKQAAIARALAMEPRYLVYDEPTTGLDPIAARQVDALIRALATETGVTSIVVSHDLRSIFSIADRVAFLYGGFLRADLPREALMATDDPVLRQFLAGEAEGPMG